MEAPPLPFRRTRPRHSRPILQARGPRAVGGCPGCGRGRHVLHRPVGGLGVVVQEPADWADCAHLTDGETEPRQPGRVLPFRGRLEFTVFSFTAAYREEGRAGIQGPAWPWGSFFWGFLALVPPGI